MDKLIMGWAKDLVREPGVGVGGGAWSSCP